MRERQQETEKENRGKEDSEAEQNEDVSRLHSEIAMRIKQQQKMKCQ
jgi:hypothetical protein